MFSSLANRNFRIFFIAQSFYVIGTFAQELALAWLVLDLTHSATTLGTVIGLTFLPMLVFAPWAGVLADRYDRRRLLYITQGMNTVLVFGLWALTVTGAVQIWMVYMIALGLGLAGAINTPTRLGFTHELVGDEHIHNAVSLTSTVYSAGRVVGPALAGLIILAFGVSPAFFLDGLTYLGMIFALTRLHADELHAAKKITRVSGQFLAGLRYIQETPIILGTLLMTLIVGIFTYEYIVSLPALAKLTFMGNAGTLSLLTSAFGLGAVFGGLDNARKQTAGPSHLPRRAVFLGFATILVAIQPQLWLATSAVVVYGFALVRFSAYCSSLLQLNSRSDMRGRVMAFYTSAWVGSNAIGGPIIGWVSDNAGPRWALALGGVAAFAAAGLGLWILRRMAAPETANGPTN